MGFKGIRMHDPLLDSIEEHAHLFALEHTELKPDEVHEVLEAALDRGLVEFDVNRNRKPEVRKGEHVEDDPIHTVRAAADRCLDNLRKRCMDREEIED